MPRSIARYRTGALLPTLDAIDAETAYLGWRVDLTHPGPAEALDGVFLFLKDADAWSFLNRAARLPTPRPGTSSLDTATSPYR